MSDEQRCRFCLNPESILTPETCCTGCSALNHDMPIMNNEWISIDDEKPPFLEKVLCWDTQKIYIAYRPIEDEYNEHWSICEDACCSCNGCTGSVTHWIPLLSPPQDDHE